MIFDLPWHKRLKLAPSYFSRLLAIGAEQLPFSTRLLVACRLTALLLKPRSTGARPTRASASTRSPGE